ncbi:uncharacterized protein [Miscanthus floridulus]|uniref:uncharacterized protein isoform X2 n=1 Tax=Miscanthus floridulus TaxID=154761 RepID=UPI003457F1AE
MVLFPRGHGRGYRVAAASHTPVLLCGLGRSIQVLMIMEPKHSAEMSKYKKKQSCTNCMNLCLQKVSFQSTRKKSIWREMSRNQMWQENKGRNHRKQTSNCNMI